eukprot:3625004-Rhodomonas_salina.1
MCLSAVSPIEDPHDRAASVEEWRARRAADLSRHHDSECKAGGSCRVDGGIADTDAAAGIDDEAMHGLLVVELSFGGLSNRRQALMQAVAAAKLLRRRLVLGDEFDSPHPVCHADTGCMHVVNDCCPRSTQAFSQYDGEGKVGVGLTAMI